jgi:DNA-binding transcriptional LysR family regulator
VELRLCDASAKDLRARLLAGDLEVAIYALPGEEPEERIHSIPLFREQMVLAVHRDDRLAKTGAFPVREMNGEPYIHRVNWEFAGYTDQFSSRRELPVVPSIGASATTGPWLWSPPDWDSHSCRRTRSNTSA